MLDGRCCAASGSCKPSHTGWSLVIRLLTNPIEEVIFRGIPLIPGPLYVNRSLFVIPKHRGVRRHDGSESLLTYKLYMYSLESEVFRFLHVLVLFQIPTAIRPRKAFLAIAGQDSDRTSSGNGEPAGR